MNIESVYEEVKKILLNKKIFNASALDYRIMVFNQKMKKLFTKYGDVDERMRNIDEVFGLIHQYLGVSEVEKKINGEVFTPFGLINEMLDTLPNEVWSNPNLKWLDPANGIGNFPAVIIQRLMDGLVDFEPDTSKRYKHILENMIYVCDISSKNMFLYLNIFDPHNEYKMNYFKGSFLSDEFDKHMEEVWGINEFNNIIGNPPYNDSRNISTKTKSLYHIFTKKSQKKGDVVLFITPSKWFLTDTFKDFRLKMINNYGLYLIKHFTNNLLFDNADIKGGVSYFMLKKEYNGDVLFSYDDKPFCDRKFIDKIFLNNKVDVILGKIKDKKNDNIFVKELYVRNGHINSTDNRLLTTSTKTTIKCYGSRNRLFYVEKANVDEKSVNYGNYKVITPVANGVGGNYLNDGDFKILNPNEVSTASFCCFPFKTEKECEYFINNITLKLHKFLIKVNKSTQNVTSSCFDGIQNFNKKLTDQQLYEYFNLTEEEINLIEETVKE